MGSWADLTWDLLERIAKRITEHTDILRFGIVCRNWHSVVVDNLHRLPHQLPLCHCLPRLKPIPLLMQCSYGETVPGTLDFLSLVDQKVYGGFVVPELNQKWISGSSNGWLVTVEIQGRQIHLLNPLTKAQILLPSLSAFHHPHGTFENDHDGFGFIHKSIVSSSEPIQHSSSDCIVISIISTSQVLSFCRVGDEKWTNINGSPVHLTDMIYYKGQYYAVDYMGMVVACDIANEMKVTIIGAPLGGLNAGMNYLVESSSGDLLQVVRVMDGEEWDYTTGFDVFKLEAIDEEFNIETVDTYDACYMIVGGGIVEQKEFRFRWVELESLGDQMLFVGRNHSLSLPAWLHPGCRANCIYFTDDREIHVTHADAAERLPYDMGVYDMEDGSIKHLGGMKDSCFSVPPIWFSPNPW